MTCGIYQISIGDYYYFGSADDCEKRCMKSHFAHLKLGKHCNKKMQNAFDKYQTFSWEVVEDCDDRGIAYAVEQRYIDANFGRKHCLNLNPVAAKPPSHKGLKLGPLSEEHKRNISEARLGIPSPNKGKPLPKLQCSHCCGWFNVGNLNRWHGDNCKHKQENL